MNVDKRDLVFLVADNGMQLLLHGLFTRPKFELTLGCGGFSIDPRRNKDVFVAAGSNDGGLYAHAEKLLSPHRADFRRAMVMIDDKWDGSPGSDRIRQDITARAGGDWERFEVVVFEPELETWLWQDNHHIDTALKYRGNSTCREELRDAGLWPVGSPKPTAAKRARTHLAERKLIDPGNAVFERLAGRVSAKGCQDKAFLLFRDTLREWFPPVGQEASP